MSPHDLQAALRDGPFDVALDRAIRYSGLSLERVQRRLAERGVAVSVTALSYWRRGRSRPERPQSLQAVRLLEGVLALPADSLVSLLGPRRPRGRWATARDAPLALEHLWRGYQSLSGLLTEVGTREDGLTEIAVHDRFEFDERGAEARSSSTVVLRAEQERVDRYVIVNRGEPGDVLPEITHVRNARLGRARVDSTVPIIVQELLLDRVLTAGETTVVEYVHTFPASGSRSHECGRGFRSAASVYTLEVAFHPSAVPVRCHRCSGSTPAEGLPEEGPVWISAAGAAHVVVEGPGPRFYALRWEWD